MINTLNWSFPCEILIFKLLAGLLYYCSGLWAVSYELQKHGVCLAPCIWHLASCILQTILSHVLHLDPCILHLTKTVACFLHLVACAGLLCQLWQLGTQCQPPQIWYHAFVPNILWLLVFDCSCLEVWPFDREAWLVWLSLQWCELDVIV